jgi:hypothetical protein
MTLIILIVTHVAAFVAGALVFKNNLSKVSNIVDKITTDVDVVKDTVKKLK